MISIHPLSCLSNVHAPATRTDIRIDTYVFDRQAFVVDTCDLIWISLVCQMLTLSKELEHTADAVYRLSSKQFPHVFSKSKAREGEYKQLARGSALLVFHSAF